VKPGFSETSYVFALCNEITHLFDAGFLGVPLFPSQRQEARLGFDVSFSPMGWPLFVQCKLATYRTTSRAKYWPDYQSGYFQFAVHPLSRSAQHNLLKALRQREPDVFYAAPSFCRAEELGQAFTSHEIIEQSRFVDLAGLPYLTDNQQHVVTFTRSGHNSQWRSNSESDGQPLLWGGEWLQRLRDLSRDPRPLDAEYWLGLRDFLVGALREHMPQPAMPFFAAGFDLQDRSADAVHRDLDRILMAYLGVIVIVVLPR
jgi:hypothetical protein